MDDDQSGRAADIQSHLWSSFYYMLSSIRADWPHGALNPGGLASDNYDTGHSTPHHIYLLQIFTATHLLFSFSLSTRTPVCPVSERH